MAVAVAALASGCDVQIPDVQSPAERQLAAMRRSTKLYSYIVAFAGHASQGCGYLEVNDARPALAASLECAARNRWKSFSIIKEDRSINTWEVHGLLGTHSGWVYRFEYIEDSCGRGCPERFIIEPCSHPLVREEHRTPPHFACAR